MYSFSRGKYITILRIRKEEGTLSRSELGKGNDIIELLFLFLQSSSIFIVSVSIRIVRAHGYMPGGKMVAIGPLELIMITLIGFGGVLAPVVLFVVLLLILNSLKRIEKYFEQQAR
jgi:hypothetical protein